MCFRAGIEKPSNILARVGTPVKELIELCGGIKGRPEKIVAGGPMMGFAFFDLETPVTRALRESFF